MDNKNDMSVFEEIESEVRSYSRSFPVVFEKAVGSNLYDKTGRKFIDFFAGAGALNYGHNNPYIMTKVIEYIRNNGITHALDMSTTAKELFLRTFKENVLKPRNLDYKVMFCGSTGTNAVEAALKLARKVKRRDTVFAFSGSFHGMTIGSLAVSSGRFYRENLAGSKSSVVFMPYPFGYNESFDTIGYIENIIKDDHSGVELPAAIILETVQAEGGIIVAKEDWLRRLRKLCDDYDILLICDDIQVGCGRTGSFFSFERANVVPDMVTLSKSISGAGLPMSLLLIKPEIDKWLPGEHNGTFRGNQMAFIAGAAALNFCNEFGLLKQVKEKSSIIEAYVTHDILSIDSRMELRGIGMIFGIDFTKFEDSTLCKRIANRCFNDGLIIERAGRGGNVLKILPPLTIEESDLLSGLKIIKDAVTAEVQ